MGVVDPGGGILCKNRFDILADATAPKRKKATKQYVDLYKDTGNHEEEQFMLMESTTANMDFESCNPFLLQKAFQMHLGEKPLDARRLRDGKMLVKVKSVKQAKQLQKINSVPHGKGNMGVRVTEHPTLNVVKGIVRCYDIQSLSEQEILDGLKDQKVIAVEIMKRKDKDDNIVNTKMAILTFKAARVPKSIDFGWYPVRVELYVPRPMRCTNCMRIGHTKKWCRGERMCAQCSRTSHTDACTNTKCVSCGDAHHTLDKQCPVFLDEFEISRIRTEKKVTYATAKRMRREECPIIPRIYTFDNSSFAQQAARKPQAERPTESTLPNPQKKFKTQIEENKLKKNNMNTTEKQDKTTEKENITNNNTKTTESISHIEQKEKKTQKEEYNPKKTITIQTNDSEITILSEEEEIMENMIVEEQVTSDIDNMYIVTQSPEKRK